MTTSPLVRYSGSINVIITSYSLGYAESVLLGRLTDLMAVNRLQLSSPRQAINEGLSIWLDESKQALQQIA